MNRRTFIAVLAALALLAPLISTADAQTTRFNISVSMNIKVRGSRVQHDGTQCSSRNGTTPSQITVTADYQSSQFTRPLSHGTARGDTCEFSFVFDIVQAATYIVSFEGIEVERLSRESVEQDGIRLTFSDQSNPTDPSATPSAEDTLSLIARVPNVSRAQTAVYSNIREETLFTDPLSLIFTSYEFDTEDSAASQFPAICEHTEANLAQLVDYQDQNPVSIGRIGDERCAYDSDNPEGAVVLWVAVRVGNQVLTVIAMGMGGNYPT